MRSVPVALRHNARSLDHLSAIHPDDIDPLAQSETAAVLLPGAEFMGAEATAPARDAHRGRRDRRAGHRRQPGHLADLLAAADRGPGRAPLWASTREALLAVTLNAAYVLELSDDLGSIEPGKRADLVLLDSTTEHMAYRLGRNPVAATFVAGEPVYVRPDARVADRAPVSPGGRAFPLGATVTLEQLEHDPHPVLARLRASEPVSWLPVLDGWLVTRHDLAVAVMRDADTFTVDDPRFSTAQVVGPSMLSLDGEDHARHRAPFAAPFRPRAVSERFADPAAAEATA